MQILFWPLVLWDQSEIILGKIKAQKLKKTGCVEVKKKAEISHRILTGGGSFRCFERTLELKLFVQADLHHLSCCSRWTILFLAPDGRLSQRPSNGRLETVPACSGVVCPSPGSVKVVRGGAGGQDVTRCRQGLTKHHTAAWKVKEAFDRTFNLGTKSVYTCLHWDLCSRVV